MRRFIAIALLLASCEDLSPEGLGIEVDYSVMIESQERTIALVEEVVGNYYGANLIDTPMTVYWTTTTCDNGLPGVVWGDRCSGGLTWTCGAIYVAVSVPTPDTTCGSALVHEVAHCLYAEMHGGNKNSEHDDSEFWSLVSDIYAESCELGF